MAGMCVVAGFFGWFVWEYLDYSLKAAEIDPAAFENFSSKTLPLLVSIPFRTVFVILVGILGGGLVIFGAAPSTPRIHRWLQRWCDGEEPGNLKIHSGDRMYYLAQLLLEWRRQTKK